MASRVTLAVAIVALISLGHISALNYESSNVINAPYTQPFDQSLRPFNEQVVTAQYESVNSTSISQVHISPGDAGQMLIMWASGTFQTGTGSLPPPELTPSIVQYGTEESSLVLSANGTTEYYNQIYPANIPYVNVTNALNYTSPALHSVVLDDLEPNTTYFYTVGDGTTFSSIYTFRSLSAAGSSPSAYPQRLITIADWGLTQNSTTTLQHVLASAEGNVNPPVAVLVGDHTYADNWYANGTYSGTTGPNGVSAEGFEGKEGSSWQPNWDAFFNVIEDLVSEVPMLTNVGNHEIEQQFDANNTIFAAVQARWKTNGDPAFADSYYYHSSDAGPAHIIVLANYADYTPGSAQWMWLAQDLAAVNRSVTPWIVVNFHNPWYTTDSSYKEFEQMRVSLEPLTYKYGVDVFYYGHVHSYERTAPVNDWLVDYCGAVHITIGDAGNGEGLSDLAGNANLPELQQTTLGNYEDSYATAGCPNVTAGTRYSSMVGVAGNHTDWFYWYRTVLTFQADGNSTGPPGAYPPGFCYAEQPLWSQYRESSFGHGTLDFLNDTHALWQWHRNQDSVAVSADQTYIIRNTTQCPNRLGSAAYAGGMMPGVTTATATA